jgi:hypothetical protein
MTTCSFNRLAETYDADTQHRDRSDAALRNNRTYFDAWTKARPSHEWPSASGISSREPHRAESPGDLPMVPASQVVPADARERGELVHVRSVSGDVFGSDDSTRPTDAAAPSEPADSRRKYTRVHGPFDGLRVGALETPVQLYDLSRGGCFINSTHQQKPGVRLHLKIELPYEGWIAVRAETLDRRSEFGFAVRFVDVTDDALARLDRAMTAMQQQEE